MYRKWRYHSAVTCPLSSCSFPQCSSLLRRNSRCRPPEGLGISELHLLPDVGFCFYFLLNDGSLCYSFPWEMLNIPVWNIWKSSVGDLFRSVKRQRKRSLFFHRWFIFHFKNSFLCTEKPLRKHYGTRRFFFNIIYFLIALTHGIVFNLHICCTLKISIYLSLNWLGKKKNLWKYLEKHFQANDSISCFHSS